MTLVQLFLFHRYKVDSVHYVTPTEDNQRQAEGMRRRASSARSCRRSARSSSPT